MKRSDMTYNGRTPKEIENNFPPAMPEVHRKLYMKGVETVIHCKESGYNLNEVEAIKNFNHELHKLYFNN